ncbi:MAG: hypothetical protein ABEJ28_13010 [Salinigranum sp.]
MNTDPTHKPDWWTENERLRTEMDLSEYEPPRFEDGTYTHEIVEELEARYGCEIQFRSNVNPEYPEDWEVRIDLESVAPIGRRRDGDGNTVYLTTPEAFRETVVEHVEG